MAEPTRSHGSAVLTARDLIHEIAARYGVVYTPGPTDGLADAIADHENAFVELDETANLLIALERAGVLTPITATMLHGAYLREQKGN